MLIQSFRRSEGFTQVELVVTLAIIAVAAAFTIPNMPEWRANARLNGAARYLVTNFRLAKMEAAKRNGFCSVTFDITVDGTPLDAVVYLDDDGDLQYDAGEQTLSRIDFSESIYKNVSLDTGQGGGDGLTIADNALGQPSIAFNSRGLPINNAGNIISVGSDSVFIKNYRGGTKTITVRPAGNIRIN
jgi:type IV fimbrial biogenesis protein FimT